MQGVIQRERRLQQELEEVEAELSWAGQVIPGLIGGGADATTAASQGGQGSREADDKPSRPRCLRARGH